MRLKTIYEPMVINEDMIEKEYLTKGIYLKDRLYAKI